MRSRNLRIIVLALLLAMLLPASGCATALRNAIGASSPQDGLTYRQMLADFDQLTDQLKGNAPYIFAAMKSEGTSTDTVTRWYRRQISAGMEDEEYLSLIYSYLWEFNAIGHLFMLTPQDRDMYLSWMEPYIEYESENFVPDCLAQDFDVNRFMYGLLTDDTVAARYELLEDLFTEQPAPKGPVLDAEYNSDFIKEHIELTELPADDAALIRFGSFYARYLDEDYMLGLYKKASKYGNIIFDIRGNGGGYPIMWQHFIYALLASQSADYEYISGFKSGDVNDLFFADYELESGYYEIVPEDDPIFQTDGFKAAGKFYNGTYDMLIRLSDTINPSPRSIKYGGDIWLLTDDGCFSAGDQFTNFCLTSGFATVVGTKTRGNGLMADSREAMIVLENSGIVVVYRPVFGFNPDGTSNSEYGMAPDIEIGADDDALERCLEEIRRLIKKAA